MYQKAIKQNNIDNVIAVAAQHISEVDMVSENKVDTGWISAFFDEIGNISDSDLQNLWGKLLAEEVIQPGSYSLRTLETLKSISPVEAKLFLKVAAFVLLVGGDYVILDDETLYNKYGMTYADLMVLDECGLMKVYGATVLRVNLGYKTDSMVITNMKDEVIFTNQEDVVKTYSLKVYPLTQAGREILKMIDVEPNREYFKEAVDMIKKNNKVECVLEEYRECGGDSEDLQLLRVSESTA